MARLRQARSGRALRTPATGFPGFIETRRKPRVITGDIWACLSHLIEERLPKERELEALGYVQQAAEFYDGAENPQIRSRPLLYYYSFLNVTKALLIARGVRLPPRTKHGISDPRANSRSRLRFEGQTVRAEGRAASHENVFPELVRDAGGNAGAREFKVLNLLGQVPGVHRTYCGVMNADARFIPARFELYSDAGEVWARLIVDRDPRLKSTLKAVRARRAFRRTFTQVAPSKNKKDEEFWFETAPERGARRGVDPAVVRLANTIRACGLWGLLTADGYRYYLGSFAPAERLPQLASAYAVMFYLGSITRYKPYDFDRIISGRYAWLVNEFLATQPRQFLYGATSVLAGVDVVRPYAMT